MRNIFPVMIAVALTAAAPAAAQGTGNSVDANTTAAATNDTAATDNMTVTTDSAMAGSANNMTAALADQPVDMSSAEPAPAKKSFPWGVLGVLGLLGLIPRKAR